MTPAAPDDGGAATGGKGDGGDGGGADRVHGGVRIRVLEMPELTDPVLIEGLPGVGNVGKLAADHLIEELGATKFAEIQSRHFPPQVLVNPDGTVRLVNNELYYWEAPKGEGLHDLVMLIGDYQGLTGEGQYALCESVLDLCQELGVVRVYTLGGYAVGRMLEESAVLGAASTEKLVEEMSEHGVEFKRGEPGGGIVGASGLLLGLSQSRGLEAVCLMGETSGYLVDPTSSKAVLEVLEEVLGLEIGYEELDERAKQMDKIAQQLKDLEKMAEQPPDEDLQYIG